MRSLLLALVALTGCATYVRPPAKVSDPATVFIANYGKHSSILLPAGEAVYVEYAFGDWGCFVENHNGLGSYLRAGVASRRSALGRRYVAMDLAADDKRLADMLETYRLLRFDVEADRAAALLDQLDRRYEAGGSPPVHNAFVRLTFVPDREHYWALNNCNHLTARWTRLLGAQVRGLAIMSDFELQSPRPD